MSKEKIFVFGRGQYFKFKENSIRRNFEIIGFIDNHPEKKYSDFNDVVSVNHPEDINWQEHNYKVLIMVGRSFFIEIVHQLLNIGVNESRILFGISIMPPYDAAEQYLFSKNGGVKIQNGKLYLYGEFGDKEFANKEEYVETMRNYVEKSDMFVQCIKNMPCKPLSRAFGREYGTPIDRLYIERFLENNKELIHGIVMEIAEDTYIKRYGNNVEEEIILHVKGWNGTYKGNLETGEGLSENIVDCLICTQTIQMIYDINAALKNIYKILKKGGTALISIHGVSQLSIGDYNKWGEYWRVTPKTMVKMSEEAGFDNKNIFVESYGNVKTSICFLYGMCKEQLSDSDFEYNDVQYPLIVGLRVRK